MPSPYDLISRAKQQKKKEDGNKRADKWAALQVNTAQNARPVAPSQEPAPQQTAASQPPVASQQQAVPQPHTMRQPYPAYQPTAAQQPPTMSQPTGAQHSMRPTPNIDAIHKRHEAAIKNANWQTLEKSPPKAKKPPEPTPEKAPEKAPDPKE